MNHVGLPAGNLFGNGPLHERLRNSRTWPGSRGDRRAQVRLCAPAEREADQAGVDTLERRDVGGPEPVRRTSTLRLNAFATV